MYAIPNINCHRGGRFLSFFHKKAPFLAVFANLPQREPSADSLEQIRLLLNQACQGYFLPFLRLVQRVNIGGAAFFIHALDKNPGPVVGYVCHHRRCGNLPCALYIQIPNLP